MAIKKANVNATKMFINEKNQNVWDSWFNNKMDTLTGSAEMKRLENKSYTQEEIKELRKKSYIKQLSEKNCTPYNVELLRKKTSYNQYKPVLLALDEYLDGSSFETVTADTLNQFFIDNPDKKDRENHLRGIFISVITRGDLNVSKDVLLWLIPEDYKKIVEMIME